MMEAYGLPPHVEESPLPVCACLGKPRPQCGAPRMMPVNGLFVSSDVAGG